MPGDDTLKEQESYLKSTYNTILTTVSNENAQVEDNPADNPINKSILDKRQEYYYKESTDIFIQIYTILFIIYIVVAVVLSIYVIIKPYDTLFKVCAIAVLVVFPFYMINVQKYVFSFITYIYNYIIRFVYNNGYDMKDSIEKDDILKPLPKKSAYRGANASRNVDWSSGLEYTPNSGTLVQEVSRVADSSVSSIGNIGIDGGKAKNPFETDVNINKINEINKWVREVINDANLALSSNATSFNMFENILEKKLGTFAIIQKYISEKNPDELYKCTTSLATLSAVSFTYVISQREMSPDIQTKWVEICNKISTICKSISLLTPNNIFKSAEDRTRETYNKMRNLSSLNDNLIIQYATASLNKMRNELNLIDPSSSQKTRERSIVSSANTILNNIQSPSTEWITETSAFGLSVLIYASLAIEYCVFSTNIYECILAITVSKAYALMSPLNSAEDNAIAISKNNQEQPDPFIRELQLEICNNISKKIIPTITEIDAKDLRESADISVSALTRNIDTEQNQMSLLMSSLETCININFITPSSISLYAFYHILACTTSYFKIKGINVGDRFKNVYKILEIIESVDVNEDSSVDPPIVSSIIDEYIAQINTVLAGVDSDYIRSLKDIVNSSGSFSKERIARGGDNILPSFSVILSLGTMAALVVESVATSDSNIKQSITIDVKKSIDRTMTHLSKYLPETEVGVRWLNQMKNRGIESFCSRPSTRSHHYDGFTYTKHVLTYSFL